MNTVLFLALFLSSHAALACLNLTGHLSGSCLYRSPSLGDLEGSIEFNIQQPTCDSIDIDGSQLSIPGKFENQINDGSTLDYVMLAMNWKDSNQQILNFDYIRTIKQKNQKVDEVNLKGYFKKQGSKIILEQIGIVDQEPVEIYCELY